jgi:hypothetical protein
MMVKRPPFCEPNHTFGLDSGLFVNPAGYYVDHHRLAWEL